MTTLVSGCAFLTGLVTPGTSSNTTGQIVVNEATAIAIQAGCTATAAQTLQQCYDARATKILAFATKLKSFTAATPANDVLNALQGVLVDLALTPEESGPLTALVNDLIGFLAPTLNSNATANVSLALLNQVATWVGSEAALFAPVPSAKLGYKSRLHR